MTSLKLFDYEKRQLEELYLAKGIPIDQYEERPADLRDLVDQWNALSGRTDTPEEVLHYMRTRRKKNQWVRFDGQHSAPPPHQTLTAEQTETLVDVFREFVAEAGHGSDALGYDATLRERVASEFAKRTWVRIPAHSLVAKLTYLRKRGELPQASKLPKDGGIGFADIDEIRDVE